MNDADPVRERGRVAGRTHAVGAVRAVALGTVHCSEDDALALARRLASTAGLRRAPAAELSADGEVGYLLSAGGTTIQAERDDEDRLSGPGPFGALPCWRFTVVAAAGSGDGRDLAARLRAELAPFSEAERACVAALNPLVAAVVERYAASQPRAGVAVVVRDHLLLEKYNLLSALRRCGLDPSRGWVIRKADQTRYVVRVAAQLREDGFRVVGAEEPLGRVAESAVALSGDASLVVLDDGGDLGIEIARLRPFHAELIESTSKGVARLLAADPHQRFLDVAGSTVKLQLSRTIAVSCVVRFREILRHERLAGERCHVVGYGRLGRHVAALLGQTGMNVTVSEILPEAREDAHNDGFPVFSSARDALRSAPHRYLFGCSGARAVGAEEVELLAGDAVLASLSSQDLRPALDWLRGHAQRRPSRGAGERYVLPGGRARTVLAYGDAINLFRAEGVSELDFDAFTALQLAAVVECARVGVARVDVGALCDEVAALQEDVLAGELA